MKQLHAPLLVLMFAFTGKQAQAQQHFGDGLEYKAEMSLTGASGNTAPLWLTANHYGLSSVENTSGYLRAAVERSIDNDSTRRWRLGYGVDLAALYGNTSHFAVHQVYAEAQYKKVRIGLGAKERDMPFMNDRLSMGGMTFSDNARPVPQLRAELAEWWNITGRAHFLSVKGHVAYGMLTDGAWQKSFATDEGCNNLYAKRVMYHSKAGYFRLGDEKRFPLTGMFGLEMVGEFGGEVWNLEDRGGTGNTDFESHQKFSHGLRDFWDAFIPGGSDVNDGDWANVAGNQLGSWVFSLDWNTPQWGVRAYMDHFFEDHSQMFFQYGWRDNLIGFEARLPKNKYVSEIVYEHLNTTDQSGAVYHDITDELPVGIYGRDAYYNHHVYGAYQHWGYSLGNPLIVAPIYNATLSDDVALQHKIICPHNRIKAHHLGISGNPLPEVSWRLLFTHQASLGAYGVNVEDVKSTHLFAEASYAPAKLDGWKFSMAFGHTGGELFGSSQGFQATLTKTGMFKSRRR